MLIYTYYASPWDLKSGDDIRVHLLSKAMKTHTKVTIFNLSHLTSDYLLSFRDGLLYISIPRKFYNLIAKLLKWKEKTDLNPLIKLTHYIDEFILVAKIADMLRRTPLIYVFGSMSLFSLFARLFGVKTKIVYDPLANYAQTLYLRSRKSFVGLLKYGLYLALHKLQLRKSDYVIYPSKIDLENANRSFNINKVFVIPNPLPICYQDIDEYNKLRTKRNDFTKPYFVLLAGGKGKTNEIAIRITIEIFNNIHPDKFKLLITGQWKEMQRYVTNQSIELTGVVSSDKLKEILAMADYGLAPVFHHVAGTFLKTLTYAAAGLNIITSPWGLLGIEKSKLEKRKVIIVRNKEDYKKAIQDVISKFNCKRMEANYDIAICDNDESMRESVHKLLVTL